jgi:hypothetical protein
MADKPGPAKALASSPTRGHPAEGTRRWRPNSPPGISPTSFRYRPVPFRHRFRAAQHRNPWSRRLPNRTRRSMVAIRQRWCFGIANEPGQPSSGAQPGRSAAFSRAAGAVSRRARRRTAGGRRGPRPHPAHPRRRGRPTQARGSAGPVRRPLGEVRVPARRRSRAAPAGLVGWPASARSAACRSARRAAAPPAVPAARRPVGRRGQVPSSGRSYPGRSKCATARSSRLPR